MWSCNECTASFGGLPDSFPPNTSSFALDGEWFGEGISGGQCRFDLLAINWPIIPPFQQVNIVGSQKRALPCISRHRCLKPFFASKQINWSIVLLSLVFDG